jgi:hypothetical protein
LASASPWLLKSLTWTAVACVARACLVGLVGVALFAVETAGDLEGPRGDGPLPLLFIPVFVLPYALAVLALTFRGWFRVSDLGCAAMLSFGAGYTAAFSTPGLLFILATFPLALAAGILAISTLTAPPVTTPVQHSN